MIYQGFLFLMWAKTAESDPELASPHSRAANASRYLTDLK